LEHREVIRELFDRLREEFGHEAPRIIQILVEAVGGMQIRIPDLSYLYRQERNRRIRNEFNGRNHEELAIKYRLKIRWVRRIINSQK
jgi:Mor family transcriptional regulator